MQHSHWTWHPGHDIEESLQLCFHTAQNCSSDNNSSIIHTMLMTNKDQHELARCGNKAAAG